jgi:hypothetical protein
MFFSSAEKSADSRKTFTTKALSVAIEQVGFYFGSIYMAYSKGKEAKMKKYLMMVAMLGLLFFPSAGWTAEMEQQPLQPEPRLEVEQRQSLQLRPEPTLESELAKGVIAPILNLIYFPTKLAFGIVGAVLGGISGWATGGDERAAEGIWRPLVGGSYFVTLRVIDGEWPFLPLDGGPYTEPAPPVEPMNRGY